jgi:hypothetical protein
VEACAATAVRPRPVVELPARGGFTFPAPYNTRGIRVTNDEDGPVLPCGYSYWSNVNAHAGQDHLLIFLGVDRAQGGAGPSLWRVDKANEAVTPQGPLFAPEHPLSWATGEGWYWSATEPRILYISDPEHLWRYNVGTRELEVVVDTARPAFQELGCVLWQWHSSADGKRHSATVKRVVEDYKPIGALTVPPWQWVPAIGDLDECQVDQSGQWLLIKENVDGQDGEDNRIVRLADGSERVLMDRDGAAGHSDNGFGYMVAADNWHAQPNALRLWMFDAALEPQGRVVYYSPTWDIELTHLAHGNARPGPPDGQWVLGSGATRAVGPRANELVAVPLDGRCEVLVIAPTLVELDAPGGGDDYGKMPKANLDPYGEFALWSSNHGSDRVDAFLVRVPQGLMPPAPEPAPDPGPPTWRMEGWGTPPVVTHL